MKDSTKEYLKAGGLFAWGLAKSFVAGTACTYGTAQTGRSMDRHFAKAEELRKEEKEVASKVSIGAEFLLPSYYFGDEDGKYIPGGKWKVRLIEGKRIALGRDESSNLYWFLWDDIKKYLRK